MSTILHITSRADWQAALDSGAYQAPSLAKDGFIHCSMDTQVLRVANSFYRGETDLVLLVIDADKLTSPLKFEGPINPQTGEPETGNDMLFPHVYGAINLDAVVKTVDFPSQADGSFILPAI